jgi:hypothetical protein
MNCNTYWRELVIETEKLVKERVSSLLLSSSNSNSSIFLFQLRYQIITAFSKVCRKWLRIYLSKQDSFGVREFDSIQIAPLFYKSSNEIVEWFEKNTSKNIEALYHEAYDTEIMPTFTHYQRYHQHRFKALNLVDLQAEIAFIVAEKLKVK